MGGEMKYPKVLDEVTTLQMALKGMSIARYGDGELRLATGSTSISQRVTSKSLQAELLQVLRNDLSNCLVCIPRLGDDLPEHKRISWSRYAIPMYTALYTSTVYGSSFITRPDSAPHIDKPEYWETVKDLWRGKRVVLVRGDDHSLLPSMMQEAASLREVMGTHHNSYEHLDRIEKEIGITDERILICLGAAATCLAYRLAKKGMHALDVGHIGLFIRNAGAFHYTLGDLISPEHRKLMLQLNGRSDFGKGGAAHATEVLSFADAIKPATLLDYGCGDMSLTVAVKGRYRLAAYDPGIPGREGTPKPGELVTCIDVLPYVEWDKLQTVLTHIRCLSTKGVYFVIPLTPKIDSKVPVLERPADWWRETLADAHFTIDKSIVVNNILIAWTHRNA